MSTPRSTLRSKDFQLWLWARLFSNFAKQMAALVVAWQVYALTQSPLALGLVGLAEALPYIGVALWAGHAADRAEKKRIIMISNAGFFVCVAALALVARVPSPLVGFIYAALGAIGLFNSFESAASASYAQLVLSRDDFPRGAAWNLSFFQVATIGGPILGGALVRWFNAATAYGVCAALALIALVLISGVSRRPAPPAEAGKDQRAGLLAGVRHIKNNRLMAGAMIVDMVAVFFGDVVAILPVFAARLGVGPIGLGVLRASPAVGSLFMAVWQGARPTFRPVFRNLLRTITVFGAAILCFAVSPFFPLSVACLAVAGAADAVSVVIRQTIYQALTPDHLRGRVASVNGIFLLGSNEVGAFESGLAAQLLGAVPSVLFGATMTLLTVAVMRWKYADLQGPDEELRKMVV
jgi:MFS family permease